GVLRGPVGVAAPEDAQDALHGHDLGAHVTRRMQVVAVPPGVAVDSVGDEAGLRDRLDERAEQRLDVGRRAEDEVDRAQPPLLRSEDVGGLRASAHGVRLPAPPITAGTTGLYGTEVNARLRRGNGPTNVASRGVKGRRSPLVAVAHAPDGDEPLRVGGVLLD